MRIIKLLGSEVSLTTANAFDGAQLIRILGGASDILLTVVDGSTTTGTVTIKAGAEMFLRKKASETVAAASAVKAVPVAFGD